MNVFNDFLPWTLKRVQSVKKSDWDVLFSPAKNIVQDQSEPITNLMLLLWEKHYGKRIVKNFKDRANLLSWYRTQAYSIWNISQLSQQLADGAVSSALPKKQPGLNLVGYSRANIGLGEDLRGYAELLEQRRVPYSIFHIGHPSDQLDLIDNDKESAKLPYSATLFCMNVIELQKLFEVWDAPLTSSFGQIFASPPWELPRVPKEWLPVLKQCDEIWAISKFVEKAYKSEQCIAEKVKYVAPVVKQAKLNGSTFTQKRPFTFIFIFDAGSYITRKNPQAVVNAFLKAFPKRNEDVRLIIKTSNVMVNSPEWKRFINSCSLDSRVTVILESYSDSQMSDLWQQCDCYVSLHRSEGFGRTIAEAVSRKIPAISTNWSGNTDITGSNNKLNVAFQLIELTPNEYPYWEDQCWAEADEEDASVKMQWVANSENREELAAIVWQNYQRFISNFSRGAERRVVFKYFNGKS